MKLEGWWRHEFSGEFVPPHTVSKGVLQRWPGRKGEVKVAWVQWGAWVRSGGAAKRLEEEGRKAPGDAFQGQEILTPQIHLTNSKQPAASNSLQKSNEE